MSRAERRRNERSKDKLTESWIYFKPIDLVNKKITIQLPERTNLEALRYYMTDLMDRYGVTTVNIEINVKEKDAGQLTKDEIESCRIGNSVVYHPPGLEAAMDGYRNR